MSDTWNGIPAPPPEHIELPAARQPARSIYSLSEAELVQFFLIRLESATGPPRIGLHPDGSPAIKSLIGVWLISQVGGLVGKKRLVNLSDVDRLLLRSVGGVAHLVREALASRQKAEGAS
jgi:hypothetical protein